MTNQEAAALFLELADLLDLAGELPFKSASYRKVAKGLEKLSESFGKIISEGNFAKIEGAGKAIREKLMVLALTGKFPALDKWRNHEIAKFRELIGEYHVKPRPLGVLIRKLEARDIDDFTAKISLTEPNAYTGQVRETALQIKGVITDGKR
jgi:DNA polymerase (family 10)